MVCQISYVEHDALPIVENNFIALETDNLIRGHASRRQVRVIFDCTLLTWLGILLRLVYVEFEGLADDHIGVTTLSCSQQAHANAFVSVHEQRLLDKMVEFFLTHITNDLKQGFVMKDHFKTEFFLAYSLCRVDKALEA